LESMITAAKTAGAYGAKLSGAGGGDCMIALVPQEKKEAVEKAITQVGGEVVQVGMNAKGVSFSTTDNLEEMFVVVDEKDDVVGYKTRYECHHDKRLIHRIVGVVVFDQEGRILLQKRSMTKDLHPGMWGISSGGHVLQGETNDEAVRRELKEEVGIDIPIQLVKTFLVRASDETEYAHLYKGESEGPFSPDPQEVDSVQFFSRNDLSRALLSKEVVLTECAYQTLKEIAFL